MKQALEEKDILYFSPSLLPISDLDVPQLARQLARSLNLPSFEGKLVQCGFAFVTENLFGNENRWAKHMIT